MLMLISRVMTAVVACGSSVGGSPMSPILRTPPFFGAWESAGATPSQVAVVISAAITSQRRMSFLLCKKRSHNTPGQPAAEGARVPRMPAASIIHDTTVVTVDDAGTIVREAALVVE